MRALAALVPAALLACTASFGWAQRVGVLRTLPATVDAVYRINFTALGDIGHFQFKSVLNGDAYTLSADARINTAIFEYDGGMRSNGARVSAVTTAGRLQLQLPPEGAAQEKEEEVAQHRLQRSGGQQCDVRAPRGCVSEGDARHARSA